MGIFTLFLLLSSFYLISVNAAGVDDTVDAAIGNLKGVAQESGVVQNTNTAPSTAQIIGKIINVTLGILGLIFFILVVYGGITWMTAGGNEEKASKAVKILTRSTIGIIIVIVAYLITNVIVFRYIELATAPVAT